MKCPSCLKENLEGAKFCKYCGNPIGNRSSPNSQRVRTIKYEDTKNQKSKGDTIAQEKFKDKTIIDSSPPRLKTSLQKRNDSDKTVIIPSGSKDSKLAQEKFRISTDRKIVGWLISYDINPNGTDFRLYEGRMKIGRSSKNDIVINQPSVSDEHALILYRNNKFLIDDNVDTGNS